MNRSYLVFMPFTYLFYLYNFIKNIEERMGIENWGRERNNATKKRINRISSIAILIMIGMIIGCDAGAGKSEQEMATKADGEKIDLVGISAEIKSAVKFAEEVKEVHTLVKSIDELAKAIGKKIKSEDGTLEAEANRNESLIAGSYQVILTVNNKLKELEVKAGIFEGLKNKVVSSKTASDAFLEKIKKEANLCKKDVQDDDAKKAISLTEGDKSKGVIELEALNKAIKILLSDTKKAVEDTIGELTDKSNKEKK
ncbi:Vsp/OspC family lipoprotein (plasmid) [Borrelia puertoricensis]|uniref:Vsp/OspC family lipoprotein n=1 Tax=Borrelia puertoricensis TaxID=2756107 RepID=UPI003EBB06DB